MRVRISGAWRDVQSGRVRIGGAWKEITGARCYVGDAWKEIQGFIAPLSVTVSPNVVEGNGFAGTVTTENAAATPSGGRAPYTYAWSYVSGDTNFSATASTSALTAFQITMAGGSDANSDWRVTVTDALGATATDTVTIAARTF